MTGPGRDPAPWDERMDDGPLTIIAAAELIRAGKLSPVELLDVCLRRIDRYEPRVKAWAYLDRDRARADAETLTAELKAGQNRGPLHGIPVGVKDIIDVFDMPTGCGSKLWANSYARRDATVVERLRQAGAVLLGKTVTTAYASFDPPPTRNPWDPSRTPGGSSSGSAAAVACGMCLGALASQTGGSISRPASFCGVCGIKPTNGRVSVDGVVPLAASMDHVGVIAGCVRDLAIMFQAIAGPDGRDPSVRRQPVYDPIAFLDGEAEGDEKEGPELFLLDAVNGLFDERAEPVMREAMTALRRKLGQDKPVAGRIGRVRPLTLPAEFSEVLPRHRTVMAVEAAAYHQSRYKRHPEDYPPRITELLNEGIACPAPEYARCKSHQAELRRVLDLFSFGTLLTPATTGPAPSADTTGDPAFNSPWSYTGLPTVSLPFAWTPGGLPLCLQLVGKRWQEASLLEVAGWCEEVIGFERREVRR